MLFFFFFFGVKAMKAGRIIPLFAIGSRFVILHQYDSQSLTSLYKKCIFVNTFREDGSGGNCLVGPDHLLVFKRVSFG